LALRHSRAQRVWLCCILLIAGSRISYAQTVIPDCEADTACLSLYDRAVLESKKGNLVEAVRLYKLAYEVRADPKLLFSIARILHRLDRKQEAIVYYKQFIESPLDDAEQKSKAEQYMEQARQGAGAGSASLSSPLPTATRPNTPLRATSTTTPSVTLPSQPPTVNPQPLTSQAGAAPIPSPLPPPPPATNPQPVALQAPPAAAVSRDHAHAKRPRWRLVVGGAAIGAGLLLTGFGGSALAAQGKCIDVPDPPAQTCDEVYATTPVGGALLGTGAAVVVGGILLMAWP